MTYDAIIVGVGGMGSAAAFHLASRGLRVLGLERFELGHDLGSSHGLTRIIRLAYFEDPAYVPLLRRAFELWRELEAGAGEPLLHVTGGLDAGPQAGRVFAGSLKSCAAHGLAHETLSGPEIERRFPGWRVPPRIHAVFQPDAGFLHPEACIRAHAAAAAARGADIHTNEPVLEWYVREGTLRVRTERTVYEAGQLILTSGAWNGALAPPLAPLLVPERQVVGWFETRKPAWFAPAAFPVFILEAAEGIFYGFPEHGVPGFKIGKYHHRHERVAPDVMDRTCRPIDEAALREAVGRYFPDGNGALLRAAACLFTNTPDEHFIIDRDPASPEVLLVSPCSGHGFKFASVIGEIVADLVERGSTRHDISLFGLNRFQQPHSDG